MDPEKFSAVLRKFRARRQDRYRLTSAPRSGVGQAAWRDGSSAMISRNRRSDCLALVTVGRQADEQITSGQIAGIEFDGPLRRPCGVVGVACPRLPPAPVAGNGPAMAPPAATFSRLATYSPKGVDGPAPEGLGKLAVLARLKNVGIGSRCTGTRKVRSLSPPNPGIEAPEKVCAQFPMIPAAHVSSECALQLLHPRLSDRCVPTGNHWRPLAPASRRVQSTSPAASTAGRRRRGFVRCKCLRAPASVPRDVPCRRVARRGRPSTRRASSGRWREKRKFRQRQGWLYAPRLPAAWPRKHFSLAVSRWWPRKNSNAGVATLSSAGFCARRASTRLTAASGRPICTSRSARGRIKSKFAGCA